MSATSDDVRAGYGGGVGGKLAGTFDELVDLGAEIVEEDEDYGKLR